MKEYHKIQSIFKRDPDTNKFLLGQYSRPEIEYLANNEWEFTEKIDGTNIRVMYNEGKLEFGGRTDNAQIPANLFKRLMEIFSLDRFQKIFPDCNQICLYGEGFGAKIQKGGGNYIKDGVSFILFDVFIGGFWLMPDDVKDIADKFGIFSVPTIGYGTLSTAIDIVKNGLKSTFGDFEAEGIVARPVVPMFSRNGDRIIVKIKGKDFKF